ncbi:hypothetical protein OPKNFCMD_2463 [Methylobacterium crusticola]|uniref:Uncharacterized protein n=1 Tax=Methylobacterium crusticola TaxID=1697972 RepID=A0ABQ4QXZ0_9HYPH|nr:hypothetical protein [Methylobacterium crusticola]GJD49730.1 hypothetical protein OPKNFCMD_2463 [Methylobacterium crusticola]
MGTDRIAAAGLLLTVATVSAALAQAPAAATPRATGAAPDMNFAFVPPRAAVTGSIAPQAPPRRPQVAQGQLPNQKVGPPKGMHVVRDICIGCNP